jgi:hypothetical protein
MINLMANDRDANRIGSQLVAGLSTGVDVILAATTDATLYTVPEIYPA